MKLTFVNLFALAAALQLCACASQGPTADYQDPLAQIGRSVASPAVAQYRSLTLGIVFTDNSKKAMGLSGGVSSLLQSYGMFTNQTAVADNDPAFLTKALDEALRRRFKDVVVLPEFEARRAAAADAVMYLDIQVNFGASSGEVTKVAVQGIFVDDARAALGQVKGEGRSTIPYPAWTFGFKSASSQAVQRFAQELDQSGELASKVGGPAVAVVPAQAAAPTVSVMAPVGIVDGRRLALVIGNGGYRQVPPLPNPVNDARLIAQTLRGLGFEVIEVVNADQATMKRSIQSFGSKLEKYGPTGIGLFYYAGHGVQALGKNYLLPVTAQITRETDLEIEAVGADWVIQQMDYAKSRLNIVILDACRNNPFSRGFRAASRGLARMDAPSGTLIAYSTAPGDVAADGAGRNSPYSMALARAMTVSGLPVEQAFKQVRLSVREATNETQTPWEASSLIGDFYFTPSPRTGN